MDDQWFNQYPKFNQGLIKFDEWNFVVKSRLKSVLGIKRLGCDIAW